MKLRKSNCRKLIRISSLGKLEAKSARGLSNPEMRLAYDLLKDKVVKCNHFLTFHGVNTQNILFL